MANNIKELINPDLIALISKTDSDEVIKLLFFEENEIFSSLVCHSIRSGKLDVLKKLICWLRSYGNEESLDDRLSEAYSDLKLRKVFIPKQMEAFIQEELIRIRFFSTNDRKRLQIPDQDITQRIELVIENISHLNTIKEIKEQFIYTLKVIAKDIYILKRDLKYDIIPWEEIEFCLVTFINCNTKEYNRKRLYFTSVLSETKLIGHLQRISELLRSAKDSVKEIRRQPLPRRPDIIQTICKNEPLFIDLYSSYEQIRDFSSLHAINDCIELALMVNPEDEHGSLIILRSLQIIGENFKSTLETPNLSEAAKYCLLSFLSKNTSEVIMLLRDSLSHEDSLGQRSEIEGKEKTFFIHIQNDLKKIGSVVMGILYNCEIRAIVAHLRRILLCGNLKEAEEILNVMNMPDGHGVDFEGIMTVEFEKLGELIKDFGEKIKESSVRKLFENIAGVFNFEKEKFRNAHQNFSRSVYLVNFMCTANCNRKPGDSDLDFIKRIAKKALVVIPPVIQFSNLNAAVRLSVKILEFLSREMRPELFSEVEEIVRNFFFLVEFELGNVAWIEKLRENIRLRRGAIQSDENSIREKQLDAKLKCLRELTNKWTPGDEIIQGTVVTENDRKCFAATEMLVLDIVTILEALGICLKKNHFFIDTYVPTLIGKNLRNFLAHKSALINISCLNPALDVRYNAERLTRESVTEVCKKIDKIVKNDVTKLKIIYESRTEEMKIQKELFDALKEGNTSRARNCLEKGADVHARDERLWTSLHFASSSPSLETVKFVLGFNIAIDIKDRSGQNCLHVSSFEGRESIVNYFLNDKNLWGDAIDNQKLNQKKFINYKNKRGLTPLHLAAGRGHTGVTEALLSHAANAAEKDRDGHSPVRHAVLNGRETCARILLEKGENVTSSDLDLLLVSIRTCSLEFINYLLDGGANVNGVSDRGSSPMHEAARRGDVEIVESLITKGAKINVERFDGITPLHHAIIHGHTPVVDLLLEKGAFIEAAEKIMNFTPLLFAVERGHLEIVEQLLQKSANLCVKDAMGMSLLHHASKNGHIRVIRFLFENYNQKKFINYKNKRGLTPLHLSVLNDHISTVEYLLQNAANVNDVNENNYTPLMISAKKGNLVIVRCLIKNGANVHSKATGGLTALHLASLYKHEEVAKILIENGSDIFEKCMIGISPAHIAFGAGSKSLVEFIISRGEASDVSIEKVGDLKTEGFVALHLAALQDDVEAVKFLKDKGCNLDVKSKSGYSALHLAAQRNNKEVTEYLIEQNINKHAIDNKRHTALYYATEKHHEEIVKIIIRNESFVTGRESIKEALFSAVSHGYENILKILLKHLKTNVKTTNSGAIISSILFEDDETLLHLAVRSGHRYSIVELSIYSDLKEYINTKSSKGFTPLHIAASEGYEDIIELLLDNGAKVNIEDDEQRIPVELAIIKGHTPTVKILVNKENLTDEYMVFNILLNTAAKFGRLDIVKYSFEIKKTTGIGLKKIKKAVSMANENHKNVVEWLICNEYSINRFSSKALLRLAIRCDNLNAVKCLINKTNDVYEQNKIRKTALQLAVKFWAMDVLKFLLETSEFIDISKINFRPFYQFERITNALFNVVDEQDAISLIEEGAFVNAKSIYKGTPLHCAVRTENIAVVDILLQNHANPNSLDWQDHAPLQFVKSQEMAEKLLTNGAFYDRGIDFSFIDNPPPLFKSTVKLLTIIHTLFEGVRSQTLPESVLKQLKSEDADTVKVIMRTQNAEKKCLISVAIQHGFPSVEELKGILQDKEQYDLANKYYFLEEYEESLQKFKNILNSREEILGENNPGTLDIKEKIGHILLHQSKFSEAQEIFEGVIEKRIRIQGRDCKDTLNVLSCIPLVLHKQGQNREALKSLQIIYRKPPFEYSDQIEPLTRMANVLRELGEDKKAIRTNRQIYKKLLEQKKATRTENCSFITLKNEIHRNIAMGLNHQTKHKKALEKLEKMHEAMTRELGPAHPSTLRTLRDIGQVFYSKKDYEKALEVYRIVLYRQRNKVNVLRPSLDLEFPDREKRKYPDNIDTLTTVTYIADVYFSQGRLLSALEIYERNLNPRKEILGAGHPEILETLRKIDLIKCSLILEVDAVDETTLEHHPNIINKISTNRPRRKSFSDSEIRICERNIRKKDSIKISRTNAELEILMGGATSNENTAAAGNKRIERRHSEFQKFKTESVLRTKDVLAIQTSQIESSSLLGNIGLDPMKHLLKSLLSCKKENSIQGMRKENCHLPQNEEDETIFDVIDLINEIHCNKTMK
ncbi:uncharacterized protein CDAR_557801 [Caerostris darwini]|uniref:Alpha-latrotoxin n=1 Tax=Caerostris darwini TaxID=1538125 RepID=A0AAV4S6Q2_9ARAC|nr:uncharacterized protein CDAR_557801 [Caerostris darwini]